MHGSFLCPFKSALLSFWSWDWRFVSESTTGQAVEAGGRVQQVIRKLSLPDVSQGGAESK